MDKLEFVKALLAEGIKPDKYDLWHAYTHDSHKVTDLFLDNPTIDVNIIPYKSVGENVNFYSIFMPRHHLAVKLIAHPLFDASSFLFSLYLAPAFKNHLLESPLFKYVEMNHNLLSALYDVIKFEVKFDFPSNFMISEKSIYSAFPQQLSF